MKREEEAAKLEAEKLEAEKLEAERQRLAAAEAKAAKEAQEKVEAAAAKVVAAEIAEEAIDHGIKLYEAEANKPGVLTKTMKSVGRSLRNLFKPEDEKEEPEPDVPPPPPRKPSTHEPPPRIAAKIAFKHMDKNGDGELSRSEVIDACRKDPEIRSMLNLPTIHVDQFEGYAAVTHSGDPPVARFFHSTSVLYTPAQLRVVLHARCSASSCAALRRPAPPCAALRRPAPPCGSPACASRASCARREGGVFEEMFKAMDSDNNNTIDEGEFVKWFVSEGKKKLSEDETKGLLGLMPKELAEEAEHSSDTPRQQSITRSTRLLSSGQERPRQPRCLRARPHHRGVQPTPTDTASPSSTLTVTSSDGPSLSMDTRARAAHRAADPGLDAVLAPRMSTPSPRSTWATSTCSPRGSCCRPRAVDGERLRLRTPQGG